MARAACGLAFLALLAADVVSAQPTPPDSLRIDTALSAELQRGAPPRAIRVAAGGSYTEGRLLRLDGSVLLYERTNGPPTAGHLLPDTVWTRESNRLPGAIGGAIAFGALVYLSGAADADVGTAETICVPRSWDSPSSGVCKDVSQAWRRGNTVAGVVFGGLVGAAVGATIGSVTSHWRFRRAWR